MYYSGQNKAIASRYADLIKAKPKENKSAREIIDDVVNRVGLSVV